jgi:hypothetical protein
MEVIFNLIIILVVVFTVMKRLQEVAQKGVDIKQPPLTRPPAPSGTTMSSSREMTTEYTTTEPEQPLPQRPSPFPLREMVETMERQYRYITEPPLPPVPVMRYEPAAEDAFEAVAPSAAPKLLQRQVVASAPQRGTAPNRHLVLAFNSETVLNGMIMSEILGPPVALRTTGPGFQHL